ncbi:MAG TPA: T9SS type A sorting domain-containing protein, partial [Chitinophagaceae bacterium]|nr:T9SS type A sorting domain-containing protein [Chitinophagaceae bacterium]
TRDTKYNGQSRPSSPDNQNLRGVFISLADLGLAVNQRFYGYSLFGPDVTTANTDWNTYPTNTSTTSGLDPVNIMGLYKTPFSVLAVPMKFTATRRNNKAALECTIYNKIANEKVIAERSVDGINYEEIGEVVISETGQYAITDNNPAAGNNFYRLKLIEKGGASGYSEIRKLWFPGSAEATIFPNPAHDVLNIRLPLQWQQKRLRISVTDIKGRIVSSAIVANTTATYSIDIKSFASGTYVLQLSDFDGMIQWKQTFITTN